MASWELHRIRGLQFAMELITGKPTGWRTFVNLVPATSSRDILSNARIFRICHNLISYCSNADMFCQWQNTNCMAKLDESTTSGFYLQCQSVGRAAVGSAARYGHTIDLSEKWLLMWLRFKQIPHNS